MKKGKVKRNLKVKLESLGNLKGPAVWYMEETGINNDFQDSS